MEKKEYEIMYRVEEIHWWYVALRRVLFGALHAWVPDWKSKRVVDAGCGTGAILQRMNTFELNVGVDLAPEAIAFCKERKLEHLVQADVSRMPFSESSFHVVVCSSVLYHQWVKDVPGALREFHRILKNGGVLLVNLPACKALHSAHDEAVFTARRFDSMEVRKLMKDAGFEIEWLRYWTSLFFPMIWLVRRFGVLGKGRDYDEDYSSSSWLHWMLDRIMNLEFFLLKYFFIPFGASILCVARKTVSEEGKGK